MQLKGVFRHYVFLTALYTLQGVTMALAIGAIPVILKGRGEMSISDLSLLGLAGYPFSLKVLWSPLVDSYRINVIGLRKTWVMGAQCLMSALLFFLGSCLDTWIEADSVPIGTLSALLITLAFVTATQDIAVDGWAIELLHGPARSFASNCQSIGLSVGSFISFTVLLALSSDHFCQSYLMMAGAAVTVGGFARFFSFVIAVMTFVVFIWHEDDRVGPPPSVSSVFNEMLSLARLPHMSELIVFLLLYRIPLGAEPSSQMALIGRGLRPDDIALASLFDVPIDIIVGYYAAHAAATSAARGRHPLDVIQVSVAMRLAILAASGLFVYSYPLASHAISFWVFVALRTLNAIARVIGFVAMGAFFGQIADPTIGATFMTLLQTFANLGGTWPQTVALQLIGMLGKDDGDDSGYFIVVAASVVLGVAITLPFMSRVAQRIRRVNADEWKTRRKPTE